MEKWKIEGFTLLLSSGISLHVDSQNDPCQNVDKVICVSQLALKSLFSANGREKLKSLGCVGVDINLLLLIYSKKCVGSMTTKIEKRNDPMAKSKLYNFVVSSVFQN